MSTNTYHDGAFPPVVVCVDRITMAIKGTVVAAGTVAGVLVSGAWGVQVLEVMLVNMGSGTAYLGGSDVGTVTTCAPLAPGASTSLQMTANDALYGMTASGTAQISVLVRGVSPQ